MADRSKIEWTDATWNPVLGCRVVSPGCINCYAMRLAGTRLKQAPSRAGLTKDAARGPVWNGAVRFMGAWLTQPLHWAAPRDIFVCAHSDLFYENVDQRWRDRIFAVMGLAHWHRFQVLTKRPDEMADYLLDPETPERITAVAQMLVLEIGGNRLVGGRTYRRLAAGEPWPWPLTNVLLGISAETQSWFDRRRGSLEVLKMDGWRTWASLEPLLGAIDIGGHLDWVLDWVVAGGESGPDARPMHPDWVRGIRDQCARLGIPFHFKQWGAWREFDHGSVDTEVTVGSGHAASITAVATNPGWLTRDGAFFRRAEDLPEDVPGRLMERVGKRAAGAVLDGREWREMPAVRDGR